MRMWRQGNCEEPDAGRARQVLLRLDVLEQVGRGYSVMLSAVIH